MSRLLIHDSPLMVSPLLAKAIGLNEAHLLQQLHYWLDHSQTTHDGKRWIYKTYQKWKEQDFPFWSVDTIKRTKKSLEDKNLIITAKIASNSFNRVNYYTINYAELKKFEDKMLADRVVVDKGKMPQSEVAECHQDEGKMPLSDGGKMHSCLREEQESNEENNKDILIGEKTEVKSKPASKSVAKKAKFDPSSFLTPFFIDKELWAAYHDMRAILKKPATEYACKLLVNKIMAIHDSGFDANEAIENSVIKSWISIYQPKSKPKSEINKKGVKDDRYQEADDQSELQAEIQRLTEKRNGRSGDGIRTVS